MMRLSHERRCFCKKIVSSTHHTMVKLNNLTLFKLLILLLLTCVSDKNHRMLFSYDNSKLSHDFIISSSIHDVSSSSSSSLLKLSLNGYIKTQNVGYAAKDFGNIKHFLPSAVLHPNSVSDISLVIRHVYEMGSNSDRLTVAARGHGHSLQGQAQAYRGVVIFMESLGGRMDEMHFNVTTTTNTTTHGDDQIMMMPYVDVSSGDLWIDVLRESLKHGFAPKSWTDYLHLTVGGTLSNAGISGQAFRHGPQISNVYQLEVVTGKGEVVICSENEKADLFYGVLGGLGQFGIITRARISLEPAPKMVKWIRVLYEDFSIFTNDQEHLISSANTFDYIEGFAIINRTGLLNSWKSSFNPQQPQEASEFVSEGKTLFCIEVAKYLFNDHDLDHDLVIRSLLKELNYIKSTLFSLQVSYVEFLDRVHVSELKLQEKGLWEVPHPWLNLLIPERSIQEFARGVFGNIITKMNNGPILIYPVNRSKWININRTSMVMPEGDIFYLVAFLSTVIPSSNEKEELDYILRQNMKILQFCEDGNLGVKQYLPHYSTQKDWKNHFGDKWEVFSKRKFTYDPLAILAPGQRIFQKGTAVSLYHSSVNATREDPKTL